MEKDISKLIYSICVLFFVIGVFYYLAHIDISNLSGNKNENKIEYLKSGKKLVKEEYNNTLQINENTFQIEIVSGKEKTSTGLSYRESMCDTCGMLFVFENESNYVFWMKDMNYDLDIIFIDNNKKIVNIFSNVKKEGYNKAEPNSSEKIRNTQKAKYVLELNAGKAESKSIKIGDTISF